MRNSSSTRESRRLATYDAIEDAATSLVDELGFDAATVEDICERAGISRRTFFNYVDSKETAVVGAPASDPGTEVRAEFVRSGHDDPLADLLRLMLTGSSRSSGRSPDLEARLLARRRRIFATTPGLAAARLASFTVRHATFVALVEELFRRAPSVRRSPDLSAHDEARAWVALVTAAVTMGTTMWMRTDGSPMEDLHACSLEALHSLATVASSSRPAL